MYEGYRFSHDRPSQPANIATFSATSAAFYDDKNKQSTRSVTNTPNWAVKTIKIPHIAISLQSVWMRQISQLVCLMINDIDCALDRFEWFIIFE